jgi:saccharopine dehydrogenase-like NADP-dependent oxidoreductase
VRKILVIGGYGAFGARVVERLSRHEDLRIVVAGRRIEVARSFIDTMPAPARARLEAALFDATRSSADHLVALGAGVVVNASGPFQAQDYALAEACIAAGVHYIDLADARLFVTGIGCLDAAARAARVAVISGASTVPGLSSALVRHFSAGFSRLDSIDIGISPGNSFDPGLATTRSIFGWVGRPMTARIGGSSRTVHGWQGLHRHAFPEIGPRWMGYADVPDLDLFPATYPALRTARTWAGVEVGLYHLGIWSLSTLVRAGMVRSLEPLAEPMLAIKQRLSFLGTDQGGMFVLLQGLDGGGALRRVAWHLLARRGHGPYVPAIASVILARRLARGEAPVFGARPCFEQFTLEDFLAEVADLDIETIAS